MKKITVKNARDVFENILALDVADRHEVLNAFNEVLDELRANDFFGTEGQLDPRRRRRPAMSMEHATANDIRAVHVKVTPDPEAGRFVAEVDNVPGAVGYDAVEHVAVIDALRSALAEALVRLRKTEVDR